MVSPEASTDTWLRAVAITAGLNVPSRRYRIEALVPYLARSGIQLDELCPRISSYPPRNRWYRLPWFVAAMAERLSFIRRAGGYNVLIIQRELISTMATVEHLLPLPRVFDVDDAIFLRGNAVAARKISSGSSLVVCGNEYLADRFSKWNKNIAIIPTGVDTGALRPTSRDVSDDNQTIGWIGTSANYHYLEGISDALTKVLRANSRVTLQIISDVFPEFLRHLGNRLDFRLWRPGIELELLPSLSVGIMPLADTEWSRGKCAFKMLQYMAAGVPVVVSPVGMNAELLKAGDVGLGAITETAWSESLLSLLECQPQMSRMGENGRRLAVAEYSLAVIAALWKKQMNRIL